MPELTVGQLPVGKYVSEPLYLEKGYYLLTKDLVVNENLLTLLKKWRYQSVLFEGQFIDETAAMSATMKEAMQWIAENTKAKAQAAANEKAEKLARLEAQKAAAVAAIAAKSAAQSKPASQAAATTEATTPNAKPQTVQQLISEQAKTQTEVKVAATATAEDTTKAAQPSIAEVPRIIEASETPPEVKRASLEFYLETLKYFAGVFQNFRVSKHIDEKIYSKKVVEMLDAFTKDRHTFLHLPNVKSNNYLIVDSVKSCFLTLALAESIKMPRARLIELGIAAILHDIGMLLIPSDLYLHSGVLTQAQIEKIREHVLIGSKALKDAGFANEVVQSVGEHHEAYDGSGYPFRMKGDEISLYGRILGITCSYVAATSTRVFRDKKPAHSGVLDILQKSGTVYDPKLSKLFILLLGLYPIGCVCQLQNGQIGVVVNTTPTDPKSPHVKIIMDDENKISARFEVIQAGNSQWAVKRVLTDQEIESIKAKFNEANLFFKVKSLFEG